MSRASSSGVYAIICWPTGKLYAGSSRNVPSRLEQHRKDLSAQRHFNSHLQRAWNKYGEAAFEFGVYKEMPGASPEELIEVESELWTLWSDVAFNMVCPGLSPALNPEVAAKISATKTGLKFTPEHCTNISAAQRGQKRPPRTPETRAKLSAAAKRRVMSPETRAKISASLTGKTHSPETRAKMSKSQKLRRGVI